MKERFIRWWTAVGLPRAPKKTNNVGLRDVKGFEEDGVSESRERGLLEGM